jgi:hypothetical protein
MECMSKVGKFLAIISGVQIELNRNFQTEVRLVPLTKLARGITNERLKI